MPFDDTGFVKIDSVVKQVLKAARERISKPELWCKYTLVNGDAVCARGAIMFATRTGIWGQPTFAMHHLGVAVGWHSVAFNMAEAELEKHIPKYLSNWPRSGIPNYNNAPTTTHDDIMAWFDRAIASC